jgi:membrane-bound lytic murein transglycosylase B
MDLKRVLLCIAISLFFTSSAQAQPAESFEAWTESFIQEALAQGVAPATLKEALPLFVYDESVIELDQKQPEGKKTFQHYLRDALPQSRIDKARELYEENRSILENLERLYGVPSGVIVALWGIESSFGENIGDYDVITSLATLAYEGRRAEFFKKELVHALHILEREQRPAASLTGSWAGAMGQCQFMPSTYARFAVDHNNDGQRDIWYDTQDILASMANYLVSEGWRVGLPWGYEVVIDNTIPRAWVGLDHEYPLSHWLRHGVSARNTMPTMDEATPLSLIQPDGAGERAFLVTQNFKAVMRWNKSTYFATTVGLFSDLIVKRQE